jgi:tetratricopeptide (TPR) repeat protein
MRRWLPAIAVVAGMVICGCAGKLDSVSGFLRTGPWWEATQAGDIASRARALETHGELHMALDHWRLVQRMAIDSKQADGEISRIEQKITAAVQFHYQNGLAALKNQNPTAGRIHFLAALRLDPAFKPALQQIEAHFSPFPFSVYTSVSRDHPVDVAQKIFGDEKKAFLVAWFNDLAPDELLTPGTSLILPKLEKRLLAKVRKKKPRQEMVVAKVRLAELKTIEMAAQSRQTAAGISAAREHLAQGRYRQSLERVESLLKTVPDNAEARELAAEARYRLARELVDHKRFLEAREVLATAAADHEPSAVLRETVHTRLIELAQIHYRNGVKHFINEDLKPAIAEWEKALACDPDHAKAHENINNARRLMQKIETLP